MSKHSFAKSEVADHSSRGVAQRRLSLLVIALGFLFASPAHAYLDPGTGSTILQLLLGGVAGSMVVLNLYWARVKAFFGFSSDSDAAAESTDSTESR